MSEEKINLRRIKFNTTNFLNDIIPETLQKDLYPNEQICETCNGIGLVVDDFPFYIKDDKQFRNRITKYKQNIRSCPDCFNGVQKLCKYCDKVLGRKSRCDCDGYEEYRKEKRNKKIKEKIDNAEKIKYEDSDSEMFFEPYSQEYLNRDEIYDFNIDKSNDYVFETNKIHLYIDAYHILENAMDHHHPEAIDMISNSEIKRLQDFLDDWCDKQNVYSYHPNYKKVIDFNL